MENIAPTAAEIRPSAVYAYFDKIQIWLRQPIDASTLRQLEKQCGRGGLYADNRRSRFDGRYCQRLEFRQPQPEVLHWIASVDGALLNGIEVALDYIFDNQIERGEAFEFFHRHLVRRWHGRKQKILFYRPGGATVEGANDGDIGLTRYDAGRWAPNRIACYREPHSRITGELNSLHLEWRANGVRAIKSAGIQSLAGLLNFDHREFWKPRLRFFEVDPERLGRLVRNHFSGRKRRTATMLRFRGLAPINLDRRTGHVLIGSVGSIQELIDKLGMSIRSARALERISNEGLLPEGK